MRRSVILITTMLLGCSQKHEDTLGENRPGTSATSTPTLRIESPAPAAWLPEGPVDVVGIAQAVSDARLNQTSLDVVDGRFTQTLDLSRGIHRLAATASAPDDVALSERFGIIVGDYAEPDRPVVDGVLARINSSGIDVMVTFIKDLITPELITKQIAAANPIAAGDVLFGAVSYEASIASLSFDTPDIIVVPQTDILDLQASLPALDIQLSVFIDTIIGDTTVDVRVTADRAVLSTTMRPGAQDGTLTMDLEGTALDLIGFYMDVSAIPDWVEGIDLIQQEIKGAIEAELIDQLNTLVPEILDETLDALDFSFETELLERTLSVEASFASVMVDSGGLEIGVDVAVAVPGEGNKTYAGVLAAGIPAPSPDRSAEMAVMLADDFLNRILFEVWRGGITDISLSTEDGSLDPEMLSGFPVDVATVNVDARLPPVVIDAGDRLRLQLAEWTVTLDTPGASLGNRLVADVAAEADLFVVVSEGALGVELGELDLDLEVLESDWTLSEDNLLQLIDTLLTPEALMGALEGLSFELPELYGVRIADASVLRAESALHTAVGIDLEVSATK